jgi:membrane-associated phospholipid phosphatase
MVRSLPIPDLQRTLRVGVVALLTGWVLPPTIARASPPATASDSTPPQPSAPTPAAASNLDEGEAPPTSRPPLRHSGKRLYWDPKFDRMDAPEMIFTGVAAGVALATNIVHPLHTGWQGGVLFDNQVRSALRLSSVDAQLEARTVSDLGLALMTTYPILVDAAIVAYWYRGSDDVALQMALIDAEAFAVTGALAGVANFLAGRARPYSHGCGTAIPENTTDCESDTRYRSFFSGHTSGSFTAAALICAHHQALQLFESAADPITCAAALVAAGAIGTLRIVGDAHYFSDVFVGAAVGTAVGLGIPLLHHYRRASGPTAAGSPFGMTLVPGLGGAQLVGTF